MWCHRGTGTYTSAGRRDGEREALSVSSSEAIPPWLWRRRRRSGAASRGASGHGCRQNVGIGLETGSSQLRTHPISAEEEIRTPTAVTATAPSTLRVYQFHHLGLMPGVPVPPGVIIANGSTHCPPARLQRVESRQPSRYLQYRTRRYADHDSPESSAQEGSL